MQFVYGSFAHDVNEVMFTSVQRSFVLSQTGRNHILRIAWGLKGKIIRPNQAMIFERLALMTQAYSIGGQSAGMLDGFGNTTPFFLDSPSSLGGVIVTDPISHDEISGAQTATYLNYKFGLQADYPWVGLQDVLSFNESVSFSNNGGGPIQVERIPATGDPILQNVTETSFYHATQSGSLSQLGQNPQPMAPLWPDCQRRTDGSAQVTLTSPKTQRGVPIEYSVTWKYDFISIYPIVGVPNAR